MRALTKADTDRGDKLRELGCIICLTIHSVHTYPAIHHLDGKTKPGCHQLTIPLCPKHHQERCNDEMNGEPMWVSLHGNGLYEFEKHYGSQWELLEQVNRMIGDET